MTLRAILLLLALAAPGTALGQPAEPSGRVAWLDYVEGDVEFLASGDNAPSALPTRPLVPGDRVRTGSRARAELALDTAAIRLDERTDLSLIGLDPATVWLELNAGTASVSLRELLDGEMFQVVTPNSAVSLHATGEYRFDVGPEGDTLLTVRTGSAEVETADGPVRVADGQRVRLDGRDPYASLAAATLEDDFDRWVDEREQAVAASRPQYADNDEVIYTELEDYGEWYDEPEYGRVWMPSYAYGGYDPFGHGYWQPYGYGQAWVHTAPWYSFTFHSGYWAYLPHRNRWCWVPRREHHLRHFVNRTHPYRFSLQARNQRQDDRFDQARARDDRREHLQDVSSRTRREGITRRELAGPQAAPANREASERFRQAVQDKTDARRVQAPPPRRDPPVRVLGRERAPPRPVAVTPSDNGTSARHSNSANTSRSTASSSSASRNARAQSTFQSTATKGENRSRPLD